MSHIFLSNMSTKDDKPSSGSDNTSITSYHDTEAGFVPFCQPGTIDNIVEEHSTAPVPSKDEEKNLRQARGLALPQQRMLSKVSDLYDRDGKGYLDPTEEAMRRMDSKNLGFLDNSKVYEIMHSLQIEQLKSQELITSLQKEHQKSMSLKRGIVYMSIFAFLLAISNIGTSFAAARLAKDTTISGDNLVTTDGGVRVATTPKNVVIKMNSIESQDSSSRRRFLQEVSDLACSQYSTDSSGSTVVQCDTIGQIDYQDAVKMYQQFCPTYPSITSASECNFDLSEVTLQCGTRMTRVLGGVHFPTAGIPSQQGQVSLFIPRIFQSNIFRILTIVFVSMLSSPPLPRQSLVFRFRHTFKLVKLLVSSL